MDNRDGLERLTEREKEPLRLWLQHKTAKEIAVELGVSHHAVEKRLKMARIKLGASSSLEAARILGEAEGYDQTVTQPPDLPPQAFSPQRMLHHPVVIGAITMSLVAAAVFTLAMQGTGTVSEVPHQDVPYQPAKRMVDAGPAEIVSITQTTFDRLDADGSGFLEGTEAPSAAFQGPNHVDRRNETGERVPVQLIPSTNDEVRMRFYQEADRDGDGRVTYAEYYQWAAPDFAQTSIRIEREEGLSGRNQPEG
ncbi:LuxR C-terminal-related transcriptional regulator [Aurantiacibacter flavus]|uniref:LuxR C-terminal-related transcriptional regulator n=1 Tax=Aurantiacibacter flavus TaxID=3145232 RepID=A0ABV0CZA7_9SPHN